MTTKKGQILDAAKRFFDCHASIINNINLKDALRDWWIECEINYDKLYSSDLAAVETQIKKLIK